MSCAVANAVMEVIERENLLDNALKVGGHLIAELKKLAEQRRIIGDVRGVGLFVGIELVRDRIKMIPATAEAQHVVSRMKEKKILISSDGPDNNVLKLKPPMVFTIENVNHFVSVLDEVLEEVDIGFDEVSSCLHVIFIITVVVVAAVVAVTIDSNIIIVIITTIIIIIIYYYYFYYYIFHCMHKIRNNNTDINNYYKDVE